MISSRSAIALQRAATRSSRLPISARRTYADAEDAVKDKMKGGATPYILGAGLVGVMAGYFVYSNTTTRTQERQKAILSHHGTGSGGIPVQEKQAGFTTGRTGHSLDATNHPDKGTKGEGVVETAKMSETIQPNRKMGGTEGAMENKEWRKYNDDMNKPA